MSDARDICPKCGGMWTYHADIRCPEPQEKEITLTKKEAVKLFDRHISGHINPTSELTTLKRFLKDLGF